MNFRVVDTNVAIVASDRSPQAGPDCVLACITELEEIISSGGIVVDDESRIIQEYTNNLNLSGQPGPGDAFLKWIWLHQANKYRCEQVRITEHPSREFAEFPIDSRLHNFDRSDRKFVAVALASRNKPEILNAVDSDWWDHRQALADSGVQVSFLCPDQFSDSEE